MIIVDFIDMKYSQDRQLLQKTLEEAVAGDGNFATIVVGMTELGLMQMTKKKETTVHNAAYDQKLSRMRRQRQGKLY